MTAPAFNAQIQNFLREQFGTGLAVCRRAVPEFLSTGLSALQIPRGTLTEVFGPPSSGRTSLLNAALARSTRCPEFCALIDACDSFDPGSATQAGVQLPHLLWVRCGGDAEKALNATDLIIQAGGFGLIALDLASVPAREVRRISLASWFRLRHAVEKTPTALVVTSTEHCTASCATIQIESRATGFQIQEGLLGGVSVEMIIGPRHRARSAFSLKPFYRK